jgi:NAD(P)H-dependent flavin oxidoreductase YrpB (nitropropane dioxygenase family)
MAKLNCPNQQEAKLRAMAFSKQFGLQLPILEAPMAGACPVELAVAVAEGGGMGAMGALLIGVKIRKAASILGCPQLDHG